MFVCAGKSSRAGQKWRAKDETIRNNLRQYGFGGLYLDVLVSDASQHRLWREDAIFDAIIADRTAIFSPSDFALSFLSIIWQVV